jgi:hypothetical protein
MSEKSPTPAAILWLALVDWGGDMVIAIAFGAGAIFGALSVLLAGAFVVLRDSRIDAAEREKARKAFEGHMDAPAPEQDEPPAPDRIVYG